MKQPSPVSLAFLALAFLLTAGPLRASERIMVGEDIYIGPDETVDKVVCIGCSVTIDGIVERDAGVIAGSAKVNGRIDGDMVVLAGGVETRGPIGGDVVVVAGGAKLDADVGGDTVATMGESNSLLESQSTATWSR